MWTKILAILGGLIALVPFLFAFGANTYIRQQAENHPHSWLSLYIVIFDRILNATLLRPVYSKTNADEISSSDGAVSIGDRAKSNRPTNVATISAEHGVRIFIDLRVGIPEKVWLFFNPMTQVFLWIAIFSAAFFLASFQLIETIDIILLFTMYAILMTLVLFAFLALLMHATGPLGVLMNLHMNPTIVIFMTKKWLFIHSAWMPKTDFRDPNIQFSASEGRFISELRFATSSNDTQVIFSYPSYFQKFILRKGELSALADNFNKLFLMAHNAPDIDLAEPLLK